MGTGDPGTATVSQAKMGRGKSAPECKKLDDTNDGKRGQLKSTTRDKSVIGPNGNGRGTTVASVRQSGGGGPRVRSAHSNQKACDKCPGSFDPGGDQATRKGKKPGLCDHFHPDPAMQKSGHAEARLLDGTKKFKRPKAMTFSIDWKPKTGPPSKMPCPTCHEYLCKAQEECKIRIFLCDSSKEGKKYPLPCPPSKQNRQALKRALDRRK